MALKNEQPPFEQCQVAFYILKIPPFDKSKNYAAQYLT